MDYVSKEEFDRLVARMQDRQHAVAFAKEMLAKAQTLDEKIKAQRAVKAAANVSVDDSPSYRTAMRDSGRGHLIR